MFKLMCYIVFLTVGVCILLQPIACDVDPSDTATILMEQLRLQSQQLEIQKDQLEIHKQQISVLTDILNTSSHEPLLIPILATILAAIGSYLAVKLCKYIMNRCLAHPNPEMPQAIQLMDFAETDAQRAASIERLRSALYMKSPASQYHSGESSLA